MKDLLMDEALNLSRLLQEKMANEVDIRHFMEESTSMIETILTLQDRLMFELASVSSPSDILPRNGSQSLLMEYLAELEMEHLERFVGHLPPQMRNQISNLLGVPQIGQYHRENERPGNVSTGQSDPVSR